MKCPFESPLWTIQAAVMELPWHDPYITGLHGGTNMTNELLYFAFDRDEQIADVWSELPCVRQKILIAAYDLWSAMLWYQWLQPAYEGCRDK